MMRHHRLARVQWARRHFIRRRANWNRVLFSDESRFALNHADGRTGFISTQTSVMRIAACYKGIDLLGGQSDGLGWDNGWPEDGLGCNARQSECSSLYRRRLSISYHTISP